jgi:DNA-binding NarL/FixJ family response regulator
MRLREMTISRILKIVICDPAELPREALAHLLINNCECEIVGAFARVGMAIEAANQHGADVPAIDLTGIGQRDRSRLIECLRAICLNARLPQLIPNAWLSGSSYNGCRKCITSACRHSGRVRPRIPVK